MAEALTLDAEAVNTLAQPRERKALASWLLPPFSSKPR